MSAGLKRVWGAGDNWRVLGYLYYRNSLEYRQLIALNPSFDIRTIPAPGVEINASGQIADGQPEPDLMGPGGGLQMVDTVIDLSNNINKTSTYPKTDQSTIYPWTTFGGYVNRLGQYTAAALLDTQRINGYMLDSPQARFDPVGELDPTRAALSAAIDRGVLGSPTNSTTVEATSSTQVAPSSSAGTGVTVNNVTYSRVQQSSGY
jgi:hypothetical protein